MNLMAKIPYHGLTEFQKNMYWGDGLHLTEQGYDWMGEHISDALIKIVKKQDENGTNPQADAETDYDEEYGDPEDISQGYIVVRKTDLY